MAKNGVFPKIFAQESPRRTPTFALCMTSALMTALVLMNYRKSMLDIFTFMILLATTATLVMYLVCALATLKMLQGGQLAATGKHTVWLAVAGVLGALYALWALIGAGKEAVLWGLVLLALGVPVFYGMRRPGNVVDLPPPALD